MATPEATPAQGVRETNAHEPHFFLACATVVTLSIAAASSTPAQAQPCSEKRSEHERQECLIRSAIYTAVSQAESTAARAQQARAQRQAQKADAVRPQQQSAAAPVTKPAATSSPPEKSCDLTKEHVDGVVKFQDTCTGEWAERDNNSQPKKAGL
jgi:hypothetical protein